MNTEVIISIVVIGTILLVMTTLFIVLLVTQSQKRIIRQQKEMYTAILETQEGERQRIGSDLHDSLGPHLSAIKIKAGLLELKLGSAGFEGQKELLALNEMMDAAVHAIREASHDLVPPSITEGIDTALAQFASRMSTPEVEVRYSSMDFGSTGNLIADTNIFRIVQELVYNAIKHAKASIILVSLIRDKDNRLELVVSDNGEGNPEMLDNQKKGIGLTNIKNRLQFLGGRSVITGNKSGGLCFTITFENPVWIWE